MQRTQRKLWLHRVREVILCSFQDLKSSNPGVKKRDKDCVTWQHAQLEMSLWLQADTQ